MQLREFLEPLAKRYDRSNLLGSIRALPEQFVHASTELVDGAGNGLRPRCGSPSEHA